VANEVEVGYLFNRNAVNVTSENMLVYLLVDVKPAEDVRLGPTPLNISLVLDRSGSMYDEMKIEYVKEASKYIIDNISENDEVSIVAFAERAKVVIPSQKATDKSTMKRRINNLDSLDIGSSTNMFDGARLGTQEVKNVLSSEKVNRVILFTDGLENVNEGKIGPFVKRQADNGITYSVFGVGDDFNEDLAMDIADSTRGKCYIIRNPSQISNYFNEELGGLQAIVIQNPRVRLNMSAGINVRRIDRARPDIIPLDLNQVLRGREINVSLNDLEEGQVQSVLLELILPPRQAGTYRIAQLEVLYDIPARGEYNKSIKEDLLLEYTTDPRVANVFNQEVMSVIDRVNSHRVINRAIKMAEQGEQEKAANLLRAQTQRLTDPGTRKLTEEAIKDIEKQGGISKGVTKRLKGATRKLDPSALPDDLF